MSELEFRLERVVFERRDTAVPAQTFERSFDAIVVGDRFSVPVRVETRIDVSMRGEMPVAARRNLCALDDIPVWVIRAVVAHKDERGLR
jgi:hypothetical protein